MDKKFVLDYSIVFGITSWFFLKLFNSLSSYSKVGINNVPFGLLKLFEFMITIEYNSIVSIISYDPIIMFIYNKLLIQLIFFSILLIFFVVCKLTREGGRLSENCVVSDRISPFVFRTHYF